MVTALVHNLVNASSFCVQVGIPVKILSLTDCHFIFASPSHKCGVISHQFLRLKKKYFQEMGTC